MRNKERSAEVLRRVGKGETNQEIADALGVPIMRVKRDVTYWKKRFGLYGTADTRRFVVKAVLEGQKEGGTRCKSSRIT